MKRAEVYAHVGHRLTGITAGLHPTDEVEVWDEVIRQAEEARDGAILRAQSVGRARAAE